MTSRFVKTILATTLAAVVVMPDAALAFQSHPGPEGLYGHQLAHIFFIVAMSFLAYWLEINGLTKETAWRLIQVSCGLFILWNLVAFVGHWVEEMIPEGAVVGGPDWTQRIRIEVSSWVSPYYILKLDHLICVPAMACLFLGIRLLYNKVLSGEHRADG